MRDLLLVFIFTLIVGSIINDWQHKQASQSVQGSAPSANASANNGSQATAAEPRRDFPDFNSFPSLNQDNFNNLVKDSDKPVFVICYSPNNLSYERMVPLVAALAQEHSGSLKVVRLNLMDSPALAQRYEVFSVPSYLVFSKGQLTTKWAGIVAKERLEDMIATAKP